MINLTTRFTTILMVAVFALSAFGQSSESRVSAQAASVSEFEVNGLKVLLKQRPSAPTLSVNLFIRGGVRNYDSMNAGIEKFTLATAVEGSVNYPRDILRRELAKSGSAIGSDSNRDFGVLSLATTKEEFGPSWDIFADIVMNPRFQADNVQRIRNQLEASLREQETDADNFLDVLETREIFSGHPYSRDPNGTPTTIPSINRNDLMNYHKQVMTTSQLLLVVVGDIDDNTLRKKIQTTIGKLPRGEYKTRTLPRLDFSKPTFYVTPRDGLTTNYIRAVYDAPDFGHPDFYPMEVATSVLRSRMFQEVRVKRQLTYAVSASMNSDEVNTSELYVTANNANMAVTVMLSLVREMRMIPLKQEDIDGMAGQFLTGYYLDRETNSAQAFDLAKYELYGGGWKNSFYMLDKLNAVTPEDVQRVSQKYFKNFRFIAIGDPSAFEPSIFLQEF